MVQRHLGVIYHVSGNSSSNISNTSSSDDTTDDDLSHRITRGLEKSADADEQTTQKDGALPADLHSVKTDTQ